MKAPMSLIASASSSAHRPHSNSESGVVVGGSVVAVVVVVVVVVWPLEWLSWWRTPLSRGSPLLNVVSRR